jgi:hypothetical protein
MTMQRLLTTAVCLIVLGAAAGAQERTPLTAAEMKALLAKGLSVTSSDPQGGKEFTSRTNLGADGRISGSITPVGHAAIAYTGTWKLVGAQLCRTLDPIQPEQVCETWLRIGPKEVIVQIAGKEASINRW